MAGNLTARRDDGSWPRFNPGMLRFTVKIYSRSTAQDALGDQSTDLNLETTVQASVAPATGSEPFIAQQFLGEVSHIVVMRFLAGLTPAKWLIWSSLDGDRLLDILAVMPGPRTWDPMVVLCKERVDTGIPTVSG